MLLHIMLFYQIESYHSSSSCDPVSMQIAGTLILLYFKELDAYGIKSDWGIVKYIQNLNMSNV